MNSQCTRGEPGSPNKKCSDATRYATAIAVSVLMASLQGPAFAQSPFPEHFDRRALAPGQSIRLHTAHQADAEAALRHEIPNALISGGEDFLSPVSVVAASGALTAASSRPAAEVGMRFLRRHVGVFGLRSHDLSLELTDRVVTRQNGVVHEYFRQTHPGTDLPVFYTQAQFHVQRGRMLIANVGLTRVSGVDVSTEPGIDAGQALAAAAEFFGLSAGHVKIVDFQQAGLRQVATVQADVLEQPAKLEFGLLPMGPGQLEPVWFIHDAWLKDGPLYDLTVSALPSSFAFGPSSRLITANSNTTDGTYKAYEAPVESPIHTSPLPPSDARVSVVDPEDAVASPSGWFGSSALMDGNNVHSCADRDGNNACDSGQPSCPGQVCDFPVDFSADPSAYTDAAIANLFYWNNIIHDVQYQYGFDEPGGNFQENNFGRGGAGSDSVNAQAQDNANGSSRCNANFSTPSDGNNPRMQMFVCNQVSPQRDGSLDNGVIVHEYGHGISIRQVGGPSTSCLSNRQQAGEGWSDWHALVYTAEAGDLGPDPRGVGSYLFGLAPDDTIRPQQYSTDPAVNSYTYESINGLSIPHGVGSVWAQVTWEMYWRLVDKHGFDANLHSFDATNPNEVGNKRALFYVNEGLKNTSCSPTFIAGRNGIISAAESVFGGEDVCDIWEVFAAFGIGTDASSGGSNSTSPTNGFSLPAACVAPPPPATCPDGSTPLHAADFELNAAGWSQGNDTCSTGSFVRGTPTQTTNGGVIIQAAGGADGTSGAFFTAPNSSAGADDVDGGTCEALSPIVDATGLGSVDIFLSYFHGQRDAGDDANDGFTIEVLNDGAVVDTPVTVGDISVDAAWTSLTTALNNPGNVQLRVRASDAAADGDLVEAGIDSVLICPGAGAPPPPPPPPPTCALEESFESGAGGWVNDGASTCATGDFIVGAPTQIVNGGVTTQVGGAASGSAAYFTATNTSAGSDDVDGGNCIARSPVVSVSAASTLSITYFHGQRDAGDDANGDFFRLEMSTDGGATYQTIASNGDTTSNAAWTTVTAPVPANASVVLRVQCADGAGPGDLVECGIDDVSICTN